MNPQPWNLGLFQIARRLSGVWGFRWSTQKLQREKQNQLGILEQVHDDFVWGNMQ
jgi:hypothetical protein